MFKLSYRYSDDVRSGGGCLATFLPPFLALIYLIYIYWYIDRNIYNPQCLYYKPVDNYGGNQKTHNNESMENRNRASCHHTTKHNRRAWNRERRQL